MILEKIKELEELIIYLNADDKLVVSKAIKFSNNAHKHQTRHSGDPFVIHPIEVAKILTSIKLDASSIAAGLLHDTVEDTEITNESIQNAFGDQISQLVQGLTKINKFSLKANKLKLGAGDDLELYHDGTNSQIRNNQGKLILVADTLELTYLDYFEFES